MSVSFCKSIHYDFAIGVECFFQTIHIGGYTTEIECKHRYIRSYGDTSGSRGGVGIHESASVEFMLGRHIGLGAGISGQWLIVDSPDVDDGAELNLLGGIFRFQFGGGLRVYF